MDATPKLGTVGRTTPFSSVRAEHLGDDLAMLYVPFTHLPRFGDKPVLVEGGRGSGKTMLFKYHSFDSKWKEHFDDTTGRSKILEKETILGFYYKTDDTVVPSMAGRSQPDEQWRDAFTSYLGYRLLREIFKALARLEDDGVVAFKPNALQIAGRVVGHQGTASWTDLAETAREHIYEILAFANRPESTNFRSLPLERAIRDVVDVIREVPQLSDKRFLFFIDEVENLNDLQQRVVATLFLNSESPIFYNLGCKVGGLRSADTVFSQAISEVHDFERAPLNHDPSSDEFERLVTEICRKRIRQFALHNGWAEHAIEDNIAKWLGEFSPEGEVASYIASSERDQRPYWRSLERELQQAGLEGHDLEDNFKILTSDENEIVNRLNLCLLMRGHTPQEIVAELDKWRNDKPSKYHDWYHNTRNGVIFLLAGDYKKSRRYYSYETFRLLSNGNVRIFIELCHAAFTAALGNRLDYRRFRALSPQEQDYAAHHVAEAYIRDIRLSRGYSDELYYFVYALGRAFAVLHRNPRQSEPEQNHFSVIEANLDAELRDLLRAAVMWSVLTEHRPTKVKDPDSLEVYIDYVPNRVYAPYFGISCRKIRSVSIPAPVLKHLLSGKKESALQAAKGLLSRYKGTSQDDLDDLVEQSQSSLSQYGATR